jgi:predicted amino acid-binding ACT domain protein
MVGRPGSAAKIFDVVARSGTNILMISQSVSESNISLVVGRGRLQRAVNALELAMLGQGGLRRVNYEDDVSAVAVVGGGMRGVKGIAARVFGAVAQKDINVRMIAQGSSEQNISLVVYQDDGKEAVRAIHAAFGLERINEGVGLAGSGGDPSLGADGEEGADGGRRMRKVTGRKRARRPAVISPRSDPPAGSGSKRDSN